MPPKKKYYAVANGRKTGIFTHWFTTTTGEEGAHAATDGYPRARHASFATRAEAERFRHHPLKSGGNGDPDKEPPPQPPQKEPPQPPPPTVAKRERTESPPHEESE